MSADQHLTIVRSNIATPVRRIFCLGLVAGCLDAIGFLDLGGIYPGAMTGNTVQLGIQIVQAKWESLAIIAMTITAFFSGGLVSSVLRRLLPNPAFELLIMAGLVAGAQAVRLTTGHPIYFELPLLAVAMAMQGQTISRFGGLSFQTIVVTNNLIKCSDALVGRYILSRDRGRGQLGARKSIAEVVLPGSAWLSYALGAVAGAWGNSHLTLPFLPPIVLLILTATDLLSGGESNEE